MNSLRIAQSRSTIIVRSEHDVFVSTFHASYTTLRDTSKIPLCERLNPESFRTPSHPAPDNINPPLRPGHFGSSGYVQPSCGHRSHDLAGTPHTSCSAHETGAGRSPRRRRYDGLLTSECHVTEVALRCSRSWCLNKVRSFKSTSKSTSRIPRYPPSSASDKFESPSDAERYRRTIDSRNELRRRRLGSAIHEAEIKVNNLQKRLSISQESIDAGFTRAAKLGQLDYKLHRLRNALDGISCVSAIWRKRILSIYYARRARLRLKMFFDEERHIDMYYKLHLQPIEEKLANIVEECEHAREEIHKEKMRRRSAAARNIASVDEIIENIFLIKEPASATMQLKARIKTLTGYIYDTVKCLQTLASLSDRGMEGKSPDQIKDFAGTLTKAVEVAQHLALRVSFETWNKNEAETPLGAIAHWTREIEMNQTMVGNKLQNALTFAERWFVVEKACLWPTEMTMWEMRAIMSHSQFNTDLAMRADEANSVFDFSRDVMSNLREEFNKYDRTLNRFRRDLRDALDGGYVTWCPHPDKGLHRSMAESFPILERYNQAWLATIRSCKEFRSELWIIANEENYWRNKRFSDFKKLTELLNSFIHPPDDENDPLSRREWMGKVRAMQLCGGGRYLEKRGYIFPPEQEGPPSPSKVSSKLPTRVKPIKETGSGPSAQEVSRQAIIKQDKNPNTSPGQRGPTKGIKKAKKKSESSSNQKSNQAEDPTRINSTELKLHGGKGLDLSAVQHEADEAKYMIRKVVGNSPRSKAQL